MRIVVFRTPGEREIGLQHRRSIERGTLFVFPGIPAGTVFHSRNVFAPFDLAFLDARGRVLDAGPMWPPDQVAVSPPGTAWALESASGELVRAGIVRGALVDPGLAG